MATTPRKSAQAPAGLAILVLIASSVAQSTAAGSSAMASPAASPPLELGQWVIPLTALPLAGTGSWGVDSSALASDFTPDMSNIRLQTVTIGTKNAANGSQALSSNQLYTYASNYPDSRGGQRWVAAPSSSLRIGSGANLTETVVTGGADQSVYKANYTFATIPFGLNLGEQNSWNGSVIFGGSYDSSRIDDKSWHKLPGNNFTSFLSTGRQVLDPGAINVGTPQEPTRQRVVLDFNSEQVVMTSHADTGLGCARSLKISTANATWIIDGSLLQSPERCIQGSNNNTQDGDVVLGKPFFQATYIYAHTDGGLYLAKAANMSITPSPTTFDLRAPLKAQPKPMSSGSVMPSSAASSRTGGRKKLHGIGLSALLVLSWL